MFTNQSATNSEKKYLSFKKDIEFREDARLSISKLRLTSANITFTTDSVHEILIASWHEPHFGYQTFNVKRQLPTKANEGCISF